jgi:hypothetical protein
MLGSACHTGNKIDQIPRSRMGWLAHMGYGGVYRAAVYTTRGLHTAIAEA